jgi:hypothetical protein
VRFRETTAGEKLRLENLELFDPVAQESYRLSPATIHIKADDSKSKFGGKDTGWDSALKTSSAELEMSHASRRNPTGGLCSERSKNRRKH